MNFSNVFMLVYDGGRCGEFLTSFLQEHPGVVNNTHGYDPMTNRYFAYETNNFQALELWQRSGITARVKDFGLANYQHDDNVKVILRSHHPLPYEKVLPGLGTIIAYSEKYNEFFSLLYWIKYLNRIDSKGQIKWKQAFGVDNIDQLIDQTSFMSYLSLVTPSLSTTLYTRSFLLNLDQLFFDFDLDPYYQLCKFLGIDPLGHASQVFGQYHEKNLNLLQDQGIEIGPDNLGTVSFRNKLKKTLVDSSPLDIKEHTFNEQY